MRIEGLRLCRRRLRRWRLPLFCEKRIGVKAEYSQKSEQDRATIASCGDSLPIRHVIRGSYFSCSDSGLLRSSFGILTSTAV